ncbi:MAG: nitrous oxide reductase family maturation protein NosD [Promethearchaeota archaeon]
MNLSPSPICILMLVVIGGTAGLGIHFVTNNTMIVEPIIISESIYSLSQKSTNVRIYTSHEPILITSNSQFTSQGFSGSGTQDDPYRIEGLNITPLASGLIRIQDTTVHVLIRENFLNGLNTASSAIFLSNVNNIKIEGNFIVNNTDTGLTIDSSSNITCENNVLNYNQNGIDITKASDVIILNNSIFNNDYGINLLNSADNNIITNNSIYNNQQHGIRLEYSSHNTVTYNTLSNNVFYGALITLGSNDNRVQFNAFTGNHMGDTQASDDGSNNIFTGNYWDDWSSPDANGDLIVDNPYSIDGNANNSDPYPLVEFSIEAINYLKTGPNYLGILLFVLIILTAVGGSIGLSYLTYKMLNPILKLNQREIEFDFEIEEPITEFTSEKLIDRLTPLYHKLVVGLENVQTSLHPQPITLPLLEPVEPISLVDYFPSDIKEDLWSGIKWRTILTLIEIAYQDPSQTNVVNLAKSLNIPRSTLSKEIKRLFDLHYIESLVTTKVMQDARYRNYIITLKGFKVLYILKEAFKMAINRLKEKQEGFYI